MIKKIFCFCLFILIYKGLQAQFYSSGEDAGSIRWRQINTSRFQVIFPDSFETEANRLANILEYSFPAVSQTLNHIPRKIPVVIHSQSSISNGLTIWAPKRIELFTTPPQDIYAQDWLEQLAIHEYRHAVQMDKLDQGLTRFVSFFFGQQAPGLVAGMVPSWFLEGDAVTSETLLSHSGRGRLPIFEMELRAQVLGNSKLYSYNKAVLGSYKDYIPDVYHLGYPIVAYARQKYGADFWSNVLNYTARNPYLVKPFELGIHKYAGKGVAKLYRETYTYLDSLWKIQDQAQVFTPYKIINHRSGKLPYTSYRFPQYVNDSLIIASKSGIDQINRFVLIDRTGKEKRIFTPGFYSSERISYSSGKLAWAEEIPDARWENRSYSVVKILDVRTKSVRCLTRKTRFFAPALSSDGRKILAVDVDTRNVVSLVILDAKNGEVIERISSPENDFLQMPVWSEDGQFIYAIVLSKEGKSIRSVNCRTQQWETIVKPSFSDISQIVLSGNTLYFTASYSGIQNVYAMDLDSHEIYQAGSSRFGTSEVALSSDGKKLLGSDYTAKGYNIAEINIDRSSWIPLDRVKNNSVHLADEIAGKENKPVESSEVPAVQYNSKPYYKLTHLLNVHSWAPVYYSVDDLNSSDPNVYPGFVLFSQNNLSTAFASAGMSFSGGQSYLHSKLTYKGFYPVFDVTADYGGYPDLMVVRKGEIPQVTNDRLDLVARAYVPLNFTRNKYYMGLDPQVQLQYKNDYRYDSDIRNYVRGMEYVDYCLYGYRYLKATEKDIMPRFGQVFSLDYKTTPLETNQFGSFLSASSWFYFPGIMKHQSLKLTLAYKKQYPGLYMMPVNSVLTRGYTEKIAKEFSFFSADYSLPLCYPDFGLGSLLYLKRIRANVFCDMGYGKGVYISNQYVDKNYSSYGTDLTADFHFLRFIFPFNAGIRYIHLNQLNSNRIEALFDIDLSNF